MLELMCSRRSVANKMSLNVDAQQLLALHYQNERRLLKVVISGEHAVGSINVTAKMSGLRPQCRRQSLARWPFGTCTSGDINTQEKLHTL